MLMQTDLLCRECGITKTPPLALCFENACCGVGHTSLVVRCVRYWLCVLYAVRLSVLMGVWTVTVTSLATVLVCVCCWKSEVILAFLRCVLRLAVKTYWSVWYRGCVIATLLTVSFHWWCMLAVFLCFVSFDALGLSSLCMYCCSVLSFLSCFFFMFFLFFFPPKHKIHFFMFPMLSFVILSRMFFHFVCDHDTQPALVWTDA